MSSSPEHTITVGARHSALSQAQFHEFVKLMKPFHPEVLFVSDWIETEGDRDKRTSLRALDKSDFFTRDIDRALLQGRIRIGLHSAKDLPEPLAPGLKIAALTEGLDPSDALVIPEGETLSSLPEEALIATSSGRREDVCRQLRPDFCFRDIRGTIEERLAMLEDGHVDGVVIAECALIRLGLTHLNRVILPGDTAALQGQLAAIVREDDDAMMQLLACVDSRKPLKQ